MPIQILPEDLVNKIAAGEVVERPASVVKELVENSIDAKASHITIEIEDAGKKLIRVIDDGVGMGEEECRLALKRHSTSKIESIEDLFNIRTLGFRGEALPSIASVSELKISPNPSGKGISVEVKDLFKNVPARLKFLKSKNTENAHISNLISKFILSSPDIAFKLIQDKKEALSSPGSGDLKDALASVYGVDLAKNLLEVKGGRIFGFISRPDISRISRDHESFFVNGRYVRNILLSKTVENACRTLIPSNRYPLAALFLSIDPKEVDVNVHPTKREVKFLRTNEVLSEVTKAVSSALSDVQGYQGTGYRDIGIPGTSDKNWRPEMLDMSFPKEALESLQAGRIEIEVSEVQPLIPVHQHKGTYIVATDGEDLVLIDQHAAHERILYDRLSSHNSEALKMQSLLIPENLEFTHSEAQALQDKFEYLKGLGFELEDFGKDSFLLRSVPSILTGCAPKEVLLGLLPELSASLEQREERVKKYMACRAAVKAGDKLSFEEMGRLIRDLYRTQNPLTCPHGRPTMIKFSANDIEKLFGRK